MGNPFYYGTLLFDLMGDPQQLEPLNDPGLERYMANLLVELMRSNEAPKSQFERLGLPEQGSVKESHLLIEYQWPQVQQSQQRNWRQAPASEFGKTINTPLHKLVIDSPAVSLVSNALGVPLDKGLALRFAHLTPWHLAVMLPSVTPDLLRELNEELIAIEENSGE